MSYDHIWAENGSFVPKYGKDMTWNKSEYKMWKEHCGEREQIFKEEFSWKKGWGKILS